MVSIASKPDCCFEELRIHNFTEFFSYILLLLVEVKLYAEGKYPLRQYLYNVNLLYITEKYFKFKQIKL